VSQDLPSLLAAGERAVFHGPPARAVGLLEQAMALAEAEGRRAEVTAAGWLLGVALASQGRLGRAVALLEPLVGAGEQADAPEIRLFGSLAAATMASVHRQLGRHQVAWGFDERGLGLSEGRGEAAFDCRLGLASDAVGLEDVSAARLGLDAAAELVTGREDWWRQRVRLDWVRAEIALLVGEPTEAVGLAVAAVDRAEHSRAPRHVAKGLLFQGVAEVQVDTDAATGTLRRAASLAEGLGTLPLIWPARALLGALLVDRAPDESARCLASARSAVLAIAADLAPEIRDEWLSRPDVSALLEG